VTTPEPCPECGVASTDACPRGVEEACPRATLGKAKKRVRTRITASPTPSTFEAIAAGIASGQSFAQVCSHPGMPHITTLWRWLRAKQPDGSWTYPSLRSLIDEARQARPEAWAEQLIEIADGKGKVPRDKLRVQTRQWLLERLRPAEYGQRVEVAHKSEISADPDALRPIARALVQALGGDGLAELRRMAAPVIEGKVEDVEG
jgi:hypothetical protein